MCGSWVKPKFSPYYSPWLPILRGDWHSINISKEHKGKAKLFFLHNIRDESIIKWKFDISIIYTQLEIGSFQQFFSLRVKLYGHLPTITYCVQLLYELEPKGINLVPASGMTWLPQQLLSFDCPITEIAVTAYNKKGSKMINRCRMFLQVISVLDLLLYNTKNIHPAYIQGELPPSRIPFLLWPIIPRPPKKYWKLWTSFLRRHI